MDDTINRGDAVAIADLCIEHGFADMMAGLLRSSTLDEAREAVAARRDRAEAAAAGHPLVDHPRRYSAAPAAQA